MSVAGKGKLLWIGQLVAHGLTGGPQATYFIAEGGHSCGEPARIFAPPQRPEERRSPHPDRQQADHAVRAGIALFEQARIECVVAGPVNRCPKRTKRQHGIPLGHKRRANAERIDHQIVRRGLGAIGEGQVATLAFASGASNFVAGHHFDLAGQHRVEQGAKQAGAVDAQTEGIRYRQIGIGRFQHRLALSVAPQQRVDRCAP